jgi:hypothetical protein
MVRDADPSSQHTTAPLPDIPKLRVSAAAVADTRVMAGVDDVDVVVPNPGPEPESEPESLKLPPRNGWKGSGVVLEVIWAGDSNELFRKIHKSRSLDEEYCVVLEIEFVTSMGRTMMV